MIVATLTKVFAGVAVLATLATVALNVIPRPESTNGVWLDTPLDHATVEAGDVSLVLHSDLPGITGIFVNVVHHGAMVASLKDTDIETVQRGKGAKPLSVFNQVWSVSEAGEYRLDVAVSGSAETKRSFTVTVLEQGPVAVDTAEGTSVPTPTPTPTPTIEPTEPGLSGPLEPGSVVRFQPDTDDWVSYFYLNTFSPQEASTAVELRITDTINNVVGDWQVYPCTGNTSSGSNGLYNCVISNHTLQPQSSFQIDGTWMTFSVEYRGVISAGGTAVYAPGGTWTTARR
jgi:hypothetical protein